MITTRHRFQRRARRGFSLVEMLIALAITAALLTSTFVALDVSFRAYQKTTEVASTHIIARLMMHRMLTLIRTGQEFGPYPINMSTDRVIESVQAGDNVGYLRGNGSLKLHRPVFIDKANRNRTKRYIQRGVIDHDHLPFQFLAQCEN